MLHTPLPRFGIMTAPIAGQTITMFCGSGARRTRSPRSSTRGCSITSCRSAATRTVRSSKAGHCSRPSPHRPSAAPRPARDQQPLPTARDAGQDRRDRRYRLRRAARLRHRRRLTTRATRLARREYDGSRPALPRLPPTRSGASPKRARSSGGCGPRPSRSTSTAPISTSPGRSATPNPSSAPTHRSSSADARPSTLRVVAEHADLWNIPGGDIDDAIRRGALLDRYCAEIGRDPASIARSIALPIHYDHPGATRDAIAEAIDAGFRHIVLMLPAPYPASVAPWVADELIVTSA